MPCCWQGLERAVPIDVARAAPAAVHRPLPGVPSVPSCPHHVQCATANASACTAFARSCSSASLAQVYTHFAEALDGLVTIRAFDDQPRFTAINEALVAATQRASIAGVATAQWLALRLQLMTAAIVFLIALLAVLDAEDVVPSAAPGRPINIGATL